jgi:hypothetical protein
MLDRKKHTYLMSAVVAEALALGVMGFGWGHARASAASENERALSHLSAVEQDLLDAKGDLEHCTAWMDSRLLAAQALDAPGPAGSAQVAPSTPIAPAAASPSAAPSESANAESIVQAEVKRPIKARLIERNRRFLEMRGQAGVMLATSPESGEGGANPSP